MIELDKYESAVVYLSKLWYDKQTLFNSFFSTEQRIGPATYIYADKNGIIPSEVHVLTVFAFLVDLLEKIGYFKKDNSISTMLGEIHNGYSYYTSIDMKNKTVKDYYEKAIKWAIGKLSILKIYTGNQETIIKLTPLDQGLFDKLIKRYNKEQM